MRWMTDAPAHYRYRAAREAGKRVIRKIDGEWWVFGLAAIGLRYESHAQALAAVTGTQRPVIGGRINP
jgi:hypothetical protein